MNPEKSELVVFRRSRQGQELHVGGQSESTKCKLLGVVVENGKHNYARSAKTNIHAYKTTGRNGAGGAAAAAIVSGREEQ